jgi:hypothetical protein
MSRFEEEPRPDDFTDVERRLRQNKTDASELDLDRIKVQAVRQARTPRPGGRPMRSRLTALVSAALLALGGGATFAIAKNATSTGSNGSVKAKSAAGTQYGGKKCGKPDRDPNQNVPPGNPQNNDCLDQSGPKNPK